MVRLGFAILAASSVCATVATARGPFHRHHSGHHAQVVAPFTFQPLLQPVQPVFTAPNPAPIVSPPTDGGSQFVQAAFLPTFVRTPTVASVTFTTSTSNTGSSPFASSASSALASLEAEVDALGQRVTALENVVASCRGGQNPAPAPGDGTAFLQGAAVTPGQQPAAAVGGISLGAAAQNAADQTARYAATAQAAAKDAEQEAALAAFRAAAWKVEAAAVRNDPAAVAAANAEMTAAQTALTTASQP